MVVSSTEHVDRVSSTARTNSVACSSAASGAAAGGGSSAVGCTSAAGSSGWDGAGSCATVGAGSAAADAVSAAFAWAFFEVFGASGLPSRTFLSLEFTLAAPGRSAANFSQIPILVIRFCTCSEGWAPVRSQCRARSSSISISEGSSSG